jgi:hypothetical protein
VRKNSLHIVITRKWIAVANLLADEPFAPVPDQAGEEIRERVASRFGREKIPTEAWPLSDPGLRTEPLLLRNPGTRMVLELGPDPCVGYDFAYSVAAVLGEIVDSFSKSAGKLAKDGAIYVHLPRRFLREMAAIEASGRLRITDDQFSQFLRELQSVDVRRIRRCEVCPRFFFAARGDQTACSKSHAKTLAMRKWRAGKGRDYDLRRKIESYYEQEGKRPALQREAPKRRKG